MHGSIDHVHNFPRSKEILLTLTDDRGHDIVVTINVNKQDGPDIDPGLNQQIALGIAKMSKGTISAMQSFDLLNAPPTQLERILG